LILLYFFRQRSQLLLFSQVSHSRKVATSCQKIVVAPFRIQSQNCSITARTVATIGDESPILLRPGTGIGAARCRSNDAVSSKLTYWKNALQKRQSACVRKQKRFHLAQPAMS
jgi:hypothetical protein